VSNRHCGDQLCVWSVPYRAQVLSGLMTAEKRHRPTGVAGRLLETAHQGDLLTVHARYDNIADAYLDRLDRLAPVWQKEE
jgi:hypothetical protein